MTSELVDAVRIVLAAALLLTTSVGAMVGTWLALRYLAELGRGRPRVLVTIDRGRRPGREPTRPRSGLAWRHGRDDLPDRGD